jgi:hypothetical protein
VTAKVITPAPTRRVPQVKMLGGPQLSVALDQWQQPDAGSLKNMSDPMNKVPESEGRDWFWLALCWLPVALLVYVLSTGPVMKLEEAGYLPRNVDAIIYKPLWAVTPEFLGRFFWWYIFDVWKVTAPSKLT